MASPIYFARGIVVEQTPYKDSVYVWLLRLAFFSQRPHVHLNYSSRLTSQITPALSEAFNGPPDLVAQLILEAIQRENLQHDLVTLPGPAEFLDIIACAERNRWLVWIDRACCHALLGENASALQCLANADQGGRASMARNTPSASDHANLALTLHLAEMLQAGQDITAELRRCCHANALALGFIPAPLPTP